jgi:drug/metabolite transporter (DMT)-like permease
MVLTVTAATQTRVRDTERLTGVALIVTSAASFGAMAIFARYAYAAGANPLTVLAMRFSLAAVVLLCIVRVRRLPFPRGRALLALAALGGIGYVGQSLSYFTALTLAPAGLVALMLYLYPGFVTALSAVTGQDRLTRWKLAALVLALAGGALTVAGGGGVVAHRSGLAFGVALGVTAALIYAVYIVTSARVTPGSGAIPSAAVITSSAAIVLVGAALATGPRPPHSTGGVAAIVAMALVSTVLAIMTFFAGLARLGPSTAATLSTLEPAVTVVLAAILLSEPLNAVQLAGGGLILAAVLLLVRAGSPRRGAAALADSSDDV